MERIADARRLMQLVVGNEGLIFNDFTPRGDPNSNLLHSPSCPELQLGRGGLHVPKIFFITMGEARSWLEANRWVGRVRMAEVRRVWRDRWRRTVRMSRVRLSCAKEISL